MLLIELYSHNAILYTMRIDLPTELLFVFVRRVFLKLLQKTDSMGAATPVTYTILLDHVVELDATKSSPSDTVGNRYLIRWPK